MLLPALLLQAAALLTEPPAEEVVVTARRRACDVRIANRIVGDREFRARAEEWAAGTPVRVVVANGASYRCLAKIVFRLSEYGVTRVEFDPSAPAPAPAR